MKVVRLAIIVSVVLLGNACTVWPWEETPPPEIDFVGTPTNAFQRDLRSAQQREVFAATRTATAREAYEKLKKDFKEADDKTKPAMTVQLATAQGDYISAQEQHMESKRSLRQAKNAYIYKLYLNKHPEAAATEAASVATAEPASAEGAPFVELISKPQTPAAEGAVETGPPSGFKGK